MGFMPNLSYLFCINDLFRYQQLIKENLGEIAKLITVEQWFALMICSGTSS